MPSIYLRGANITAQWYADNYSGTTFPRVDKFLIHTTETGGWPGYSAGASAPNATYYPKFRQIRQHFGINRSARALRDPSSTLVRENRDNVFQLEVICYSQYSLAVERGGIWVGDLTASHLRDIAAMILQIHRDWNLPLQSGVTWREGRKTWYNDVRLSGPQFDAYRGILGHVHASGNCVTADVPVLCSDLVWRPAGELLPGDELIAFDELAPDQQGRRLRKATVVANEVRRAALMRVNTASGSIRCTPEHPWLVRRGRGVGGRKRQSEWGAWQWVATEDLQPGDEVCHVLEPWQTDRSWESGWLAGMYDGEGSLSIVQVKRKDGTPGASGGVYLSCAQRVSDTAEEMLRQIKERVPVYSLKRAPSGLGKTDMVQATIQRRSGVLRMLGMVRPARLLAKAQAAWENATLGKFASRITVESVEWAGTGLIAAMTTSTGTYIAGGFAMHNTHWDPGGFRYSRLKAALDYQLVNHPVYGGGSVVVPPPPAPEPPPPLDLLRKATDMILVKQAGTDPTRIWLLTGASRRHVADFAAFTQLKAAGVPFDESAEVSSQLLQWFPQAEGTLAEVRSVYPAP